MLNPEELSAWYKELNLSRRARGVIDHVRSSEPARRVGGGPRNVSGCYPSRKMGVIIQFESHRVELAGIYEMEHDDSVLEYYDQSGSIKLDYFSAGGRRLGAIDIRDFFVLRKEAAGWEEWKTEDELVRLAQKIKPLPARCGRALVLPARRKTRDRIRAVLRCAVLSGDQLDFSTKSPIPGRLLQKRSVARLG